MKFKLNLIREIQAEHEVRESRRKRVSGLICFSYGILVLVLIIGIFQVVKMRAAVIAEKQRLALVKAEYQRYKASEMIVTKADVEMLDKLQNSRIFWTKKLLVMARYLPDDYWITKFGYDRTALVVDGYGYISDRQEQLLTLHAYLDALRNDGTFTDVFRTAYLNSTVRNDDNSLNRERVSFSYTGLRGGPK